MYSRLSDAWNSDKISLDTNQTELSLNTLNPLLSQSLSLCDGSWKHVRECKSCQSKLKKLIDLDVEDRLDRLLLEKKLSTNDKEFPWKDAAMIGLGTAVVVLLFLLVLKQK